MILFGHPSGGPFSHHAALSHYEAGRLAAFCVPWMPSPATLRALRLLPGTSALVSRLSRRDFPELRRAPLVEGRLGEISRLCRRAAGVGDAEGMAYQANDWLMRTMRGLCARADVTAVHAYEDCSLWQFEEAKRLGKTCLYDMPIGYYPAWETTEAALAREYERWMPGRLLANPHVRPQQKQREMALADKVIAASTFVKQTIHQFIDKPVAVAPYGVDLEFWRPTETPKDSGPLRFIFAGQSSLRKGVPLLIDAWKKAGLRDATLEFAGSWQLAPERLKELPAGVRWVGPLSSGALRDRYRAADVFVFPSYFEGFGMVLLEAMACGLPAIATTATIGPDVIEGRCGRIIEPGNLDELVAALQWFDAHRSCIASMGDAARAAAQQMTWAAYRAKVTEAVDGCF